MKARKKLYSPVRYIVITITLRIRSILILTENVRFYVHLNNWHPKHLTLTLVEGNYYITVQDSTENESRFNVRGIMYTKEVHVTRPY